MMKNLILAAMVVVSASAAGEAAEAVMKASRGHVSVRGADSKTWVRAAAGMELKKNDQVMTGKDGAVQLSFANGATMLVKERSRFAMKTDKWGKIIAFRRGEFLIGLRTKLQGNDRFRVKTPVAVAAVRGTVFWGKHEDAEGTSIACFTGVVDVWAKGKNVALEPGLKTTVSADAPPADPVAAGIPPEYIQNFSVDGSLQGIDEQIASEIR